MNPRFLAESEKGMLWEPRVIESGRGTVEGFKEDEKGKKRASVLSSFSLSWFSVIHVFMLSVHALSSLVRLVTSLRGADFWSCVSSTKRWWFTEWLAMISERGVVYRTKPRMGSSTEPWGTPYMSCECRCTVSVTYTPASNRASVLQHNQLKPDKFHLSSSVCRCRVSNLTSNKHVT